MPIDPGSILITIHDHIAHFTFGHPKSNSLPGPLLRNMANAFDQLSGNRDVSVIFLQSLGHAAFCAGASFAELSAIRDEAQGKEFFSGFAHLLLAMRRCPKFIVTRVQGKAAGGGVGIIAASDYVFAVPAASVRLSELAIGIGPFVVGPVIERRIGAGPFTAMSIDAEWRDAAWAERHGLYAKIVDSHLALDSVCPAFTARLAAANPQAIAELKKTFWAGTEHWETLLFDRAALSGRLVLSEHSRRAIEAFASA